ncbi:uncharacterized protein KY384_000994 [Bacidia gigantensis]|uniref:uncharacterized protein n=1 Tax=Bacidia gigantensis TaxID=2732470 RepID=UPI001D0370B7|nr:uncharacterized protein KY384_000994 [Bacidia gigantensis]KAG8534150.1 hypothetical protein KY384_000994 [Bacidia gigantensis]
MADKEATVYIIDLGNSMSQKHQGRTESDLDYALKYVWEKITSTVATERKTAKLGVIGLRTDRTENASDTRDGFNNISVLQEIDQLLLPGLKELRSRVELSRTDEGDAISAIVVAIMLITNHCKKLKYKKRIVLVTSARGSVDGDDIPQIAEKLTNDAIELVVVGVDFDDAEYGFKEEGKSELKASNEKILERLVEGCDGVFGTMQQAVEELQIPRLKPTRPVPSYKGQLTLGNPEDYENTLSIDVERYPRISIRKPLNASSFVQRKPDVNGTATPHSSATLAQPSPTMMSDAAANPLATIHNNRAYFVSGDEIAGGKKEVNREDLAKGYEYGRTAVHISESDLNVTKLETQAGLEIIGFVQWDKYERYMNMSASSMIIAQKTNSKAILALSSLIRALVELESYAVARLVTKSDKEPEIKLLIPSVEHDYECLLDVSLPFTEDVRSYKFPPLDRVITVSGKHITENRNLPNDTLKDAMSAYVDRMNISQLARDDEGNPCEYMAMADTYSPVLHRIDQAVRWRAINPDKPIPPPYEILIRYSNPPTEKIERSASRLKKLVAAADVKKVPPKTQARQRTREAVKPLSGLDVGALLGSKPKTVKISRANAIPDFRQALDQTDSDVSLKEAAAQFGKIIEIQIKDSFADQEYDSALEKLGVMRQEMIEVDEPDAFNDFIRKLKDRILKEKLNGDRREMWWLIKRQKLGLIPKNVSQPSNVTEDEAKDFYTSR